MRTKNLILTVVLALFMGTTFVGAEPASPEEPEVLDIWDLDRFYSDYRIVPLDPAILKADLEDGRAVLVFYGESFAVDVVQEEERLERLGHVHADYTVTYEPLDFPGLAYMGTLVDRPDTFVLITLTEAGVAGTIRADDLEYEFYPVVTHEPSAPNGLTVVFPSNAVVVPDLEHAHAALMDEPDTTEQVPSTITDAVPEVGDDDDPEAAGPNRVITMWADSDMSRTGSSWSSRVWNAYYKVRAEYPKSSLGGFSFNIANTVYYCSTESCDTSWGLNKADGGDVLKAWGNNLRDYSPVSYELGALTTGKTLYYDGDSVGGLAYQPGRYSVNRAGGVSDAWYTKILGHEIGHNFNGDHGKYSSFPGRATTYTHNHGFYHNHGWWHDHGFNHVHETNHCHFMLLGICISNHKHYEDHWHEDPHWHSSDHWHDVYYTHYTLMNYVGSASTDEWVWEFSTANRGKVQDCNQYSWSGGTKTAASTSGFGVYCTT